MPFLLKLNLQISDRIINRIIRISEYQTKLSQIGVNMSVVHIKSGIVFTKTESAYCVRVCWCIRVVQPYMPRWEGVALYVPVYYVCPHLSLGIFHCGMCVRILSLDT